ncbi:DUF2971 domain-containing protein [Roseovarius sp. EL26]|uniref:DUF2971 domain-containing protein n=1 Tax=Roseovarius sp. EL26 TaxID=2126672 RepID=UPI000EA2439D|nr:DUF2971 domain-containing protein [Roseovarius sp. EL26]
MTLNKNNEFPEFLYRYRSDSTPFVCDELKEAINSRRIYFSSLVGQNDPFDCNPSFKQSSAIEIVEYFKKFRPGKLIIEEATAARLYPNNSTPAQRRNIRKSFRPTIANVQRVMNTGANLMDEQRRKAFICCFSESWDNPLMWSHYSNSHQGYCIKYRFKQDLIRKYDDHVPLDVQYSSERPKLTILDLLKFADEQKTVSEGYNPTDVLHAIAYQKPEEWEYEKEWRVHSTGDPTPGYKTIMALEPVEIILGANSDERVPEVIRQRVNSSISISKVYLDAHRYSLLRHSV